MFTTYRLLIVEENMDVGVFAQGGYFVTILIRLLKSILTKNVI